MQPGRTGHAATITSHAAHGEGTASQVKPPASLPSTPVELPERGKSLDPGPGYGPAEHGNHAPRQVDAILGLYRKGPRVALPVFAIVEHARPLVGAGLLGVFHDEKPNDGLAALGRIGVLVVRQLSVRHLGELGAEPFASAPIELDVGAVLGVEPQPEGILGRLRAS